MTIPRKRIEKLEKLAQKKSNPTEFRMEDLLAVMVAVERGDEEMVKKYPAWMAACYRLFLLKEGRSKRRKG